MTQYAWSYATLLLAAVFRRRDQQRPGPYDLAEAKAPIATDALWCIAALYEIEGRVRGRSADDRLIVRQAESKPLVADLRIWFEAQIAKLPARGPTAEAIRYALNHWDGLERFLEDGRIELDTNTIERAMRPVCLSRKIPYLRTVMKVEKIGLAWRR